MDGTTTALKNHSDFVNIFSYRQYGGDFFA